MHMRRRPSPVIVEYNGRPYGWALTRAGIILYVGKYRIRCDRIEKI